VCWENEVEEMKGDEQTIVICWLLMRTMDRLNGTTRCSFSRLLYALVLRTNEVDLGSEFRICGLVFPFPLELVLSGDGGSQHKRGVSIIIYQNTRKHIHYAIAINAIPILHLQLVLTFRINKGFQGQESVINLTELSVYRVSLLLYGIYPLRFTQICLIWFTFISLSFNTVYISADEIWTEWIKGWTSNFPP